MKLVFYNYRGYTNKLNKALADGVTIEGNFNMNYDTSDCTIKIAHIDNFNYNYCFVEDTGRYYFVEVKDINRNGILFLHLHIDVLQTYAEKIRNSKIRLSDSKTNTERMFESDDIVNKDYVNVMVTLGGV